MSMAYVADLRLTELELDTLATYLASQTNASDFWPGAIPKQLGALHRVLGKALAALPVIDERGRRWVPEPHGIWRREGTTEVSSRRPGHS